MRAAFSLLALVIVAAIVLSLVKKQTSSLPPPAAAGTSAASAPLPRPQAVGRQVQDSLNDAARRAADAASASTH